MSTDQKTLYLVDGSSLFYRAYFAFIRNPLINSSGENISATYGYVNSLLKLIRDEKPDYLAVVFDTKEPTFRHKMYDEYKSTRAKMPEELAEQIPRIREATEALNIPHFELIGYEADDIIGTFAVKGEKEGLKVYCVTGDKDYFQLVSDNIFIYYPKPGGDSPVKMGREEVKLKFGVYPELVIDKLALMGDASDNIPGVPGVGPKTADGLLEQFGDLDTVLKDWEQIKAKGVRQKIGANHDKATLSKELVTIELNVPLEFKISDVIKKDIKYEETKTLFLELELNRLLKQITPPDQTDATDESATEEKVQTKSFYHGVPTIADLKKLIKEFTKADIIAVDTETTSIDALKAELVGVSLADRANSGYYIPLAHEDKENNLPFKEALEILKPLLENPKVQKVGQNIKYDLEVFHKYDIDITPVSFDTMVASYVLNPSARQNSLDIMALKHFDYKMQPISDLIGSGKNQKSFATVPVDKAIFYAAEDADLTFRLHETLAPKIKEMELEKLFYDIEVPLIKVLAVMEESGVRIDRNYLKKLSIKMEKQLVGINEKIYEIAGGEFNINSTQQLSHILFEKLELPTKGKTAKKTGYSTDVKVLEELSKIHPLPKQILEYRQLTKLKNTYIDALPRLINEKTQRVHTSFNQTIAATGRLSSTDPNLQNIPIRTEEGRQIRKAFIPRDENHTLLVADYSQIELRILAHYAQDQTLINAFNNKEDIHIRTAAEVYGVKLDEVDKDMRRAAKTANFAIIYGVTAYGLTQQTDLTLGEAKDFIETYFKRYPGIRDYMDKYKQFARDNGYVTTLFNRRRPIPEINDRNNSIRMFAERIAINTPIQGTAADMIKLAMINIQRQIEGMASKMILQVHDELIFDVQKDELEKMKQIVKTGMETVVDLDVPIVADMGTGDNWLDAK